MVTFGLLLNSYHTRTPMQEGEGLPWTERFRVRLRGRVGPVQGPGTSKKGDGMTALFVSGRSR